jgi:6-phosphogluconolactonase
VNRRVEVLPDAAALAKAAAEEFARAAEASKGPFRVALSGGQTPRTLNALLADEKGPYRARIPWDRLQFFWGDERCVPPDHADSNYRMALESLLSRVPVAPGQIHRVEGELPNADAAADRYEDEILRVFDGLPRFDWVFLGLGPDGHTASLFPGTLAVVETKKLVTAVWVEQKKSRRVTLTRPVLNSARKVCFLVAGTDKAGAARRAISEEPADACPASLIRPPVGELVWFLDRGAGALLKS